VIPDEAAFFPPLPCFLDLQPRKAREHDARRLKTSAIVIRLRDSDLAGLDVLGFGESQRHETLIDFRANFVGID
jgi:hypothetical protein